jgi:hypothetical protein
MPPKFVAGLSLAAVLGLVVLTVGAITTANRETLTVVVAIACAPSALVIGIWAIRTQRHEPSEAGDS